MREILIERLQRKIQVVNRSLVDKYDSKLLKVLEDLQKEVEIQTMYKFHESKND